MCFYLETCVLPKLNLRGNLMSYGKFSLGLAIVIGTFLAGCTSTRAVKNEPAAVGYKKFVQMDDGQGEVHKFSGLQCPAILGDMKFDKSHIYNPNGTDVSCGWREGADRRYITVYATQSPDVEFTDYWKQTLAVVNQVETPRGLSYDPDKTMACTLAGLISVAAAANKGEAKSGKAFSLETAVFTSDATTSVVTSHPAAGGWMIKVRSTRPQGAGHGDEKHFVEMCMEASDITQIQSANITAAGWE